MLNLLKKYTGKLISQGLAVSPDIIFLAVDDEMYSYSPGSRPDQPLAESLRRVFKLMNINALLHAVPKEPYRSILQALIERGTDNSAHRKAILPQDCETRTFFHEIPVIDSPKPESIANILSERKAAVIEDGPAIVAYGTVSPEQAFVSYSSTCFSTFVKYFYDYLMYLEGCAKEGMRPDTGMTDIFKRISSHVAKAPAYPENAPRPALASGFPEREETAREMIKEAGGRVVEERLVDSYFGNISLLYNERIYISETAASLDELEDSIDAVPLDGSSSVGITASSELSTHRGVFAETGARVILHGHPKFSVIMSMYCLKECRLRGRCFRDCPEKRYVCGVPVVPGEVGTGPSGIVNTVPKAFKNSDAVIVYGHGVFTAGELDFNFPFERMKEIERCCKDEYMKRTRELISRLA